MKEPPDVFFVSMLQRLNHQSQVAGARGPV